ncbi:MAG: metallophosphoesterase family protein [bacterium]
MKKIISQAFYFLLIAVFAAPFYAGAESFVSIHGYPHEKAEVPDYQIQTQSKVILNQVVDRILYPVLGFPAMITEKDREMSFIIRSEVEPAIEYVKIIREVGDNVKEFQTLIPKSIELCGKGLFRVKLDVPVILPAIRYDLAVKLKNEIIPIISKNSVFFPEYDGSTRFFIWTDPQIEDLQSKIAKLDFNSEEYPFKSDSILDFSKQEGIIKATISNFNAGDRHFVTVLGDLVFGINYQREYEDILSLLYNYELPIFPIPGNHDGYAKFTVETNLNSPLEWDGLEYWAKFIGPHYYAFSFNEQTFLMLNSYDGTPQRRAAGDPIGLGDNAAVPVANWGGFFTEPILNWIEIMMNDYNVFGLFTHMTPLGQNAEGVYVKMKKYTKTNSLGLSGSQEWNIESADFDSDPTDSIFLETSTRNTGITAASFMTKQSPPPICFSGHTHKDAVYYFEKGEELVKGSGVLAKDDMEFIMTTTGATSGKKYWGFRKIDVSVTGDVSYNYTCDRGVDCFPDDNNNKGFQSVPSGNMWVKYNWETFGGSLDSIFTGGDGFTDTVNAEVINYLPTEEPVLLRFFMPANSGYKVENSKFSITNAGLSNDGKMLILIVKGSIEAGTELDKFLAKNFSRKVEFVTVKPSSTPATNPVVEHSESIFDDEPIVANVSNGEDFLSLVWTRNEVEFAQGDSFSVMFDDYEETETVTLTYISKNGAHGTASFTTEIKERPVEEPDEELVEEDLESFDLDNFEENDTEINDIEIIDEEPAKKKKSGCSVTTV